MQGAGTPPAVSLVEQAGEGSPPRPQNEPPHALRGETALPFTLGRPQPIHQVVYQQVRLHRRVTPAACGNPSHRGATPSSTPTHTRPISTLRMPLKVSGRRPAAVRVPALGGSSGGRGGGRSAEPLGLRRPLTRPGGPGESEGGDGPASRGTAQPGGQAALPGPPPPLGGQRPGRAPPRPRRARHGERFLPAEGPAPTGPALPRYLRARWPGPAQPSTAPPGPASPAHSPLPPVAHPAGSPSSRRRRGRQDALSPRCPMLAGLRGYLCLCEGDRRRTRSPRPGTGGSALLSRPLASRCPASTRRRPPAPTGRAARRSQPQRQTFPSARPRAPPPAGSGGGAGVRPGPAPAPTPLKGRRAGAAGPSAASRGAGSRAPRRAGPRGGRRCPRRSRPPGAAPHTWPGKAPVPGRGRVSPALARRGAAGAPGAAVGPRAPWRRSCPGRGPRPPPPTPRPRQCGVGSARVRCPRAREYPQRGGRLTPPFLTDAPPAQGRRTYDRRPDWGRWGASLPPLSPHANPSRGLPAGPRAPPPGTEAPSHPVAHTQP